MFKNKQRLKWTHELEIDFWEVVDDKGINSSGEDIWKNMKNKDLVTIKQVTSHLKYTKKFIHEQSSAQPIEIPYENVDNYSVFSCMDIETTGFGRDAQIISIALISSCPDIEDFSCYIAPTKTISKGASKVNKLSTKIDTKGVLHLYKNRRPIDVVNRTAALSRFIEVLTVINLLGKSHYMLTHNGYIADLPWLFRELIEYNIDYENTFQEINLCDTMKWARDCFDISGSIKNEDLYKNCYDKSFDAHDALADAQATLAWSLHKQYYIHIEMLKSRYCMKFVDYMDNFLENEEVLMKKDIIDTRLKDPAVMAHSTRKKIARTTNTETIDNIIKDSNDVDTFHKRFKEDVNVRHTTSVKVYNNFEDMDIITKKICSNCNKKMREYTSKKEWSKGKEFYACFKHNQFCWKDEEIIDCFIVHSLERYGMSWEIKQRSVGDWFIEKVIDSNTGMASFNSKSKEVVYNAIDDLYKRLTCC